MRRKRRSTIVQEYLLRGAVILFVLVVLRWVVISPAKILGEAMWPTLSQGDLVLVFKLPYGLTSPLSQEKLVDGRSPKLGSVVIAELEGGAPYGARVVGVEGDKIAVKDGVVFRNDEKQTDSHEIQLGSEKGSISIASVVVPPGYLFLLPDNRVKREDLTQYGLRPNSSVVGEVIYIVVSFEWSEKGAILPQIRRNRVFQGVH